MRFLLTLAAAILSAAVLLTACNSNELASQKSQNTAPPTQAPPPPAADTTRRITPAELKEKLAKNEAILIDVRGEAAYKAEHVKGSLQIPYAEVAQRSDELPKDKLIATYCT